MPRGLSTAAKVYNGPFLWAVKITLSTGAVHLFAEADLTFLGETYKAYLRVPSGFRLTRSLLPPSGDIELLNADLFPGGLVDAASFEGADCEVRLLLVGIDEKVLLVQGKLQESEQGEDAVRFRFVGDPDPANLELAERPYAQLCTQVFGPGGCGYDRAAASFVENLAERTADIFSSTTIGDSTLAMGVDAHKDRYAEITAGTGKGQRRQIASNTATTLTLIQAWETTPDATSKFKVFTFTKGAPKALFTSTSSKLETTATSGAPRTIADSGLSMTVDEHKGEVVRIMSGNGAGQERLVKSNTAAQITIDDDEPDFSPAPDATSVFRVYFGVCPKDIEKSCEQRARIESFNGFPMFIRQERGLLNLGGGGAPGGGGDDGGGGGVGE